MPSQSISVYLGQEFDSLRSRIHRKIHSALLRFLGKSIGPRTVIESTIINEYDKIYSRIKSLSNCKSQAIWIPEPSVDLWNESLRRSLDRSEVLLGPSIDIFNPNVLLILKLFENLKILVPSQWVYELYAKHFGISEKCLRVWPAGVDHEFWKPSGKETKKHVLLYLKSDVSPEELSAISEFAKSLEIEIKTLKYGKYSKRQYRRLLVDAKFLIWAGKTESQGLAQFEAWSMNVPCLIRKSDKFLETDLGSASPFLSNATGIFTQKPLITMSDLHNLLLESNKFSPRRWIIQNATSELARAKLLDIALKD